MCQMAGVDAVHVSLLAEKAEIEYDPDLTNEDAICAKVWGVSCCKDGL